jgi:hypothetical protein
MTIIKINGTVYFNIKKSRAGIRRPVAIGGVSLEDISKCIQSSDGSMSGYREI